MALARTPGPEAMHRTVGAITVLNRWPTRPPARLSRSQRGTTVFLETDKDSNGCSNGRGVLGGNGAEVASGSVELHTTAPVSWTANVQPDLWVLLQP